MYTPQGEIQMDFGDTSKKKWRSGFPVGSLQGGAM